MNDFVLVLVIASVAAFLTYLGALDAERFDVPFRLASAGLKFAAGIITVLVALSLMYIDVTHQQVSLVGACSD